MLYGTLNNAILNQPGPLDIEDPAFAAQLERAFCLILQSARMWPARPNGRPARASKLQE
jgi:hypothetical protein